jgi:hypothetical protein
MRPIQVYLVTSSSKQFDLVLNRPFGFVVLLEASRLPLLRAVPSLLSGCPFVLFGDSVLDSHVASVFSHLARAGRAVHRLSEMYNCEPAIVAASRIAWGSELTCASPHASVSARALRALAAAIRPFFEDALGMDRPVVYIEIESLSMAVLTAIVAGMVFEEVRITADRSVLPRLAGMLFRCRTDGPGVFSAHPEFMAAAAARVTPLATAAFAHRTDVVVAVAVDPDAELLRIALGLTRRKLVLLGRIGAVGGSPLWAALLNQLPRTSLFRFPREAVDRDIPPFRSFGTLFEGD